MLKAPIVWGTSHGPVFCGSAVRWHRAAALMAAAGMAVCWPAMARELSFTDVTEACGVQTGQVHPSFPIYAKMVGGGCVGDFNRDGWQDIFVLSGCDGPDRLFINTGQGTFVDEAVQWGVALTHLGCGAAAGDFDGDSWLDIFVTSYGTTLNQPRPGRHLLYRNNGDGTFSNVSEAAGVATTSPGVADGFGASFGDYDLDGDLDLAVAGWAFQSDGNRLFRNNGDGTFTDVSPVALGLGFRPVRGFAPRFVDMDGDRLPELLWVADYGTSRYLANVGGGMFVDMTGPAGVGLDSNGMGNTVGDFNGDGLLDWYVTSIHLEPSTPGGTSPFSGNMLYLNQGGHRYAEVSHSTGTNDGGWGWGAAAIDMNHDGLIDLVETNGWPESTNWLHEPAKLFLNDGAGGFAEVAVETGLTYTGQGRGLASIDYDEDGDQDLVFFSNREPMALYRNDLTATGANWIRLVLDTSARPWLAPDGLGSRVHVTAGNGPSQLRVLDGGTHYTSTSELVVHFGLGEAAMIDELRVVWANGQETVRHGVAVNQRLVLHAPPAPPGDANGDLRVSIEDLSIVLGQMNSAGPGGDLNEDGMVDMRDLTIVLGNFGRQYD